jgi:hypothetical protein
MKYYKDKDGDVFAYESHEDREQFGADDLVAMTQEEIEAHLNPAPAALTREQVEALRLQAYADPITGSDRHFAEANRLQVMGADQAEIDAAKSAGVARYTEIQEQYPWP